MLSINRQFVLFGNYNGISFNDIIQLEEIRKQFSFQMGAMPDILSPISIGMANSGTAQSRPVFQSLDNHITVFFGTNRIHVEETDGDSDKYNDFVQMSRTIIDNLMKQMDIKVNRIAINGQLFFDDEKRMDIIYKNLFKSSHLYSTASDEWQTRIRSIETIAELGCYVNKIVAYSRGSFIDNHGQNKVGLIAGYDYNTQADAQILFNREDITSFIQKAIAFRNGFLTTCGG